MGRTPGLCLGVMPSLSLRLVVDYLVWYTEELYLQYVWHRACSLLSVCMCVFEALDMVEGRRKINQCGLQIRSPQTKKHPVGLPTTLLKKKTANNFTPAKPTKLGLDREWSYLVLYLVPCARYPYYMLLLGRSSDSSSDVQMDL